MTTVSALFEVIKKFSFSPQHLVLYVKTPIVLSIEY